MIQLRHTLSINTLYLAWQPPAGKTRYLVGTITKESTDTTVFFYNKGQPDYENALKDGFTGYPSFKLSQERHSINVIESFLKRLPPRSRGDYKKYLLNHGIPDNFDTDNFSLLAHTGARLPSDGFALIPDLLESPLPFDYIMEVAGTRHNMEPSEVESLEIGDTVLLQKEPDNEFDPNAISVLCQDKKVGYVNKLLCESIGTLIDNKNVNALIARKSGTIERPLIFVLIEVR